jgi:hypothetical protein
MKDNEAPQLEVGRMVCPGKASKLCALEQNHTVLVVGEPNVHISLMIFNKIKGRLSGD